MATVTSDAGSAALVWARVATDAAGRIELDDLIAALGLSRCDLEHELEAECLGGR